MFIQWDNSIISHNSTVFRNGVKQFHDNITSIGTGITHMSEIENQFNFTTGVIPVSTSTLGGVSGTKISPPLYYKFVATNRTVYITIRFFVAAQGGETNTNYLSEIISTISITDTFRLSDPTLFHINSRKNAGNVTIYDNNPSSSLILFSNYSPYTSNYPIYGNTGFLYSDVDSGILIFGDFLGLSLSDASLSPIKRSVVFSFSKSDINGITTITPYINNATMNFSAVNPSLNKVSVNGFNVRSGNNTHYYTNDMLVSNKKSNKLIPLVLLTHNGIPEKLKNIFTYNMVNHTEKGLHVIDGRTFFLIGDFIRDYNFALNDHIGLAIEVTNDL